MKRELQEIYNNLACIYEGISEKNTGVFLGQPSWEPELRELSRVCRDLASIMNRDKLQPPEQQAIALSHGYRDLAEATEFKMGELWEPLIRNVSRAARKLALAYGYSVPDEDTGAVE